MKTKSKKHFESMPNMWFIKGLRKNKIALGMTYTDYRRKKISTNNGDRIGSDATRLKIYGTCDKLASLNPFMKYFMKRVTLKHPIDPSYTKEAWVLNDAGRARLIRKKQEKPVMDEFKNLHI